jgi:hypothetical protein
MAVEKASRYGRNIGRNKPAICVLGVKNQQKKTEPFEQPTLRAARRCAGSGASTKRFIPNGMKKTASAICPKR